MSILTDNIKKQMELKGWNAYDLESKSGVPQSTIHRILSEAHQDPRTSTVKKLAKGFGITEAELRGFTHSKKENESENDFSFSDIMRDRRKITCRQIPLISWSDATEWVSGNKNIKSEIMITTTTQDLGENAFSLTVHGDVNAPEFKEGEEITVDPSKKARDGDYILAKSGDDVIFRQLIKEGGDWYLKAVNSIYPIKLLGDNEIIGVIREKIKTYF
jgi:SOS-response transcriptional repressor LexA